MHGTGTKEKGDSESLGQFLDLAICYLLFLYSEVVVGSTICQDVAAAF